MKKITLTVAFLLRLLTANAQFGTTPIDTSQYQTRKLKLEEINLVSSYYHQDGNNSAVTGGLGTELLTDYSNTIDLRLSRWDSRGRQHAYQFDLGVDHYTSASSDKIDPLTVSSASRSDTRIYPSVSWSVRDDKKRIGYGAVASYSHEYDYESRGVGLNFTKTSRDGNRELGLKASAFLDQWKVILPAELRPEGYGSGSERDPYPVDYRPRNSFAATLSLAQIINKQLEVLVNVEPAWQTGLLSTQFHRAYFTDGSVGLENLPGSRLKLPIGLRANYFAGDRTIIRAFYRFYADDWGMVAHTANLEMPIKITPFISISPYYRFYTQTAAIYFSLYGQNNLHYLYRTSDYDLSRFTSQMVGTGIRLAPPNGVLGLSHWNTLELRYGHYTRSTGLHSDIVTLAMKFK